MKELRVFEVLKKELLKQLSKKPHGYALRAWVPGCSNGEEAYSIAVLIRECMDKLKKNFDVQIFGTDIDTIAIDKARTGIYPIGIAKDITETRLKRFFIKEESTYPYNDSYR